LTAQPLSSTLCRPKTSGSAHLRKLERQLELAKLYDENGSQQDRIAKAQEIDTKYLTGYQALFGRLIELGKAYAAKHNIKVQWNGL
jgi:hypothetical protein